METNQRNSLKVFLQERQVQGKKFTIALIVNSIEKGTGIRLPELKKTYSEDTLFQISLHHVTTTKKALCTALNIPVEAGCRYKRSLEKEGKLVQSIDEFICPITKHPAHLISTNPNEFESLLKSNSNQLNLFRNGS
ncbi:MAG: hypothetical protein P8O16_02330 [Algoriphagus sp.]|uniref:hypothetical protein n=1 Tax=Algoriphagus sp. TaxID=1872435 RepID=UPI00261C2B40|nr:hypothetical protein [Algoriphagus sp.]MDG1276089.1 hypothetical protein [Algoriphagus sp.]